MIARTHRVAACLLILQGVAYTVTAGFVFDRLSLDALRFAGTGLGWIFLGLLNLAAIKSRSLRVMALLVGANGLGLLHFVLLGVARPAQERYARAATNPSDRKLRRISTASLHSQPASGTASTEQQVGRQWRLAGNRFSPPSQLASLRLQIRLPET